VKTYDLFVESGPKRRKTMVHVPALLGCIAQGPTTDDALAAASEAIRTFLSFIGAHGETADPTASFEVRVAEHVTEGMWLGNGDPSIVFASDLPAITPKELALWIARWHAIRTETEALLATLSTAAFLREPAKGRGAVRIVGHILGASPAYLRTFGPVTELNRLAR
jgi:predicted RNase H-like HicB family nuclease